MKGPRDSLAPSDERATFERALTREILISERLRVTLLALIPGAAMLGFLSLSAVYPDLSHRIFHMEMDRVRVGLFLGVVAVYESVSLYQVERLIRTGAKPPALRRYVNAAIEVSLPTIVVLYYMTVVTPVDALLLPPAWTYFVFILLSTLRLDFLLSAFTGAVAAFEYALVATAILGGEAPEKFPDPVLATAPHHLGKALILLVSGVAAGFVARRLRSGFENTFRSLEERGRIVAVFGQHVSPAIVDRLLEQRTDAKSEVRDVCVMFLDIRNFTHFCESRTPDEVVTYLNSVFGFMVEIVNAQQGVVNKFLGDGFMAVFGAPLDDADACGHAVDASLAIAREVEARVASGAIPATAIGIGLHAGPAVIGIVGSGTRKEYTVIGDVVNVASRVESLNKELGTHILATEAVWSAAARDDATATAQQPVKLRGRDQPVVVYALAVDEVLPKNVEKSSP